MTEPPTPRAEDRSVLERTGPDPARTVPYGPAAHQVYEVHEPSGSPRAWVVLIHGGFWRAEWDRTHLRPLAGALTRDGYAVALVEYARPGLPGGGWPGTGEDVAAAVAAVLREEADGSDAAERAGSGDTAPVVLAGHSAGGHLAVWLLHRPEGRGVRGAVSLAGCLDLRLVHELGLGDGAALNLMGQHPEEEPDGWAAADPARLGRTPYPVVVLHGDEDERVPETVSQSWWEQAATPGRDRLVLLPGAGHFQLIDPEAAAYAALLDGVEDLLSRP
ncbi:alpha/beta hydrolase family protein [Ornithinimicrobium sufpigmenti]|uniref:alpha/beta hydrolase family protein n=1 Tax=Ornithinimicrobium sufpigmenti TaxID=2508882 RepID=UPI0010357D77|nr:MULTISPECIES: alpha/beta hydrolase [unclassified Ornithinimicrobium]